MVVQWLRRGMTLIRWVVRAAVALTAALAVSFAALLVREEPLRLRLQAAVFQQVGNPDAAEPLFKRVIQLNEKTFGPEHDIVALDIEDLARLYASQSRYAEAEPLYRRLLHIREKALGPDHPNVAVALNNLAFSYRVLTRYGDAEPLYKRSLDIRKMALGPEHPDVAGVLSDLGGLYQDQGRYDEAEALYKSSLALFEKALGPDHPAVANALLNLAWLYHSQGGDNREAQSLNERALGIAEKSLGPDHPLVASALNNIGVLHRNEGRYAESVPLFTRAIAIYEKAFGPAHTQVAVALENLALAYVSQGRYAEAETANKRVLAIRETAFGPDHPLVADSVNNLGLLYKAQGRYAEAEPLLERNLAIDERTRGPDHGNTAMDLHNLANLYFAQGNWTRAAEYWRRNNGVIQRRVARGVTTAGLTGRTKGEWAHNPGVFEGLIKASYRLMPGNGIDSETLAREMFETAQWVESSEAAASLAQMAARGAAGKPEVAAIARERQDLVSEWQQRDKQRTAALTQQSDKRDSKSEALNAGRLAEIDARIGEIDARLAKDFSDYAALASAKPASTADVQASLRDDEALVLFLDTPEWPPTPEETFIWVVTKSGTRWVRSEIGSKGLRERVTALRCGLDAATWSGEGNKGCASLLGLDSGRAPPRPLPFDHGKSHELYKILFGGVEDLIKDKQLLIVASGPLALLPFQVLVTSESGSGEKIAWLARDHAITVLPAVSSLKALRRTATPSAATRPMIAFANPKLDGDPSSAGNQLNRDVAHYRQSCGLTPSPEEALIAEIQSAFVLGAKETVTEIRRLAPVPGTAKLVCDIAAEPMFAGSEVLLGDSATEARVRELNASGELAKFHIVQFATHGLTAGQVDGKLEPGLVLTPPDTPVSETDDGYLSASEIAELKLDADWVILSACNTAAGSGGAGASGGTSTGEALSGLARAFIYAQARALLVSHWSVNERAAVMIVTSAMRHLGEPGVGRSEALRRAMLELADSPDPVQSHPSYWAPFILVGEGASTP